MSDAQVEAGPDSGAHHRRLGPYTVLEKLPPYGMVQPYVVRRDGGVDLLILKRLLLELSSNPTARSRFQREAVIAQHLRHPNVVTAQAVGEDHDVFYLVTEWVRGVSLHAVQERLQGRPLPLPVFRRVALGVLDGIGYAHAATTREGLPLDVVHRDLAPRSILLSFSGEVKIIDFGVARARVDDFKTSPGMAVGSVPYFSPEQAQGRALDRRSDLYTLGVVFYELLTGRPVVREDALLPMLRAVVGEEPAPLASLRPDLPPALVQAIQRAMAKEPEERWADAVALRAAMAASLPPGRDDHEEVSRFVRQLFPDREAETIALVDRIREVGASLPSPVMPVALAEPERERLTQVVRSRRRIAEEPPEPSVMTMPGVPVPARPEAPTAVVVKPPARGLRTGVVVGAGLLALSFLGAALWATLRSSEPGPAPAAAPQEAAAPAIEPAVSVSPAAATEAAAPIEVPVPAPASARPAAPPRPEPRRTASPPPRAPDPSRAVEAPAPPPASPPAASSEDAGLHAIRQALRVLRRDPRDVMTFERTLAALRQQARALGAADARAVGAHLDAAERSFDVDELVKAFERVQQSKR